MGGKKKTGKKESLYCISNDRYRYTHEDNNSYNNDKESDNCIDAHHVIVPNNKTKSFCFYLFALSLPVAAFSLYLLKGESMVLLFWSSIISAFLVKSFRKTVAKESIIIMRAFGVQLETQYKSGKKVLRFFPMDKILKPVLNECVTPVTCYWSLSLIVRGEEELVLVFKGMRPPLKMLLPIWKALCAATTSPQTS